MQTTVTIPQEEQPQTIQEFRFRPGHKDVTVILLIDGERKAITINIQAMLDTISSTNKNVIRQWYKNMGTLAVETLNSESGVVYTPIEGEAFDDV